MCSPALVHFEDGAAKTNIRNVRRIPRTRGKFVTRTMVLRKAVLTAHNTGYSIEQLYAAISDKYIKSKVQSVPVEP